MATSFYIRFPGASANITGSVDVNIHDAAGSNITNGQQTMANSVPVVIASNQTAVEVSASSLPLPTGAATEATLSTLNGKVTACNTGAVVVSSSALPSGAATEATLSTLNGKVTACNTGAVVVSSSALPSGAATEATLSDLNGKFGSIGQQNMAGSAPVVIASNQSNVPTREAVNSNGSIVNTSLTATTASSASAPANAVGFVLEAPSTNTDNIRWCVGGTASTTVGMLAEPGRDTGYIPMAATISVCATVSGTNAFSIQWVLSS